MQYNDEVIKEILSREGYVTPLDIEKAENYAKANKVSLVEYLLSQELLTKDLLGQAVAEAYGIPYADLNSNQPSKEQVLRIPVDVASVFRVVVFNEKEEEIVVTTDNPAAPSLKQKLDALFSPKKIILAYSLPEDIDDAFIHYRTTLETRFQKIIESQRKIAPGIIDEILADALLLRASDVHIEPREKEALIRFRIDGVLHDAGRISPEYHENILNRIKVQAHLRIDEKYAMQDGAIRYSKDGREADIRVSIAPTLDGEKVVLRLLAEYVRGFALSDLGLSSEHQKKITEASKKPFGMILVTGPTGSGKTTTLYALLKTLNTSRVNIATIEDPVEYKILGVNQIQVNPEKEITFAKGLRSIVRQDPNIILVGEIRDRETTEISINAALTGHLLLSTFHANDAVTAIPRLIDMGAEPFLLASTLEVIIAERLVRKICESCRVSREASLKELHEKYNWARKYIDVEHLTIYEGKGCNVCNHTGYKGRTGIFEFITVTPKMQALILKNPSSREIWHMAREEGSRSLFEDGIEKAKNGITSIEELLRVAEPPE